MADKPDYSAINKAECEMLAPFLDKALAVVQAHNRKRWADALRSGKYKQGKKYLHRKDSQIGDTFCCLGVACHLFKDELNLTVREPPAYTGMNCHSATIYDNHGSHLPPMVRQYLGLSIEEEGQLVFLNDTKKLSFNEIADRIENDTILEGLGNE